MSKDTSIGVWAYSTPRYRPITFIRTALAADIAESIGSQPVTGWFGDSHSIDLSGLKLTVRNGLPSIRSSARPFSLAIKRLIDIAVSLIALIAFSPLFLAIALAIKITSPGPVLFYQTRSGLGGRPIVIVKFRSFHAWACTESGNVQVQEDDPRLTPLGRFLRRTNIDELPQFLNILLGDMSLVGPRPHTVDTPAGGMRYDDLVPYYHMREAMKPGLSGWAQINGYRGPTTDPVRARARIDHDLAYIENFSLLLDLKIIMLTLIRETFGGTGS